MFDSFQIIEFRKDNVDFCFARNLVFAFILISQPLSAAGIEIPNFCLEEALSTLKPLEKHPLRGESRRVGEIGGPYGYRIDNSGQFKNLKDGDYIFLIDSDGDIYISERAPSFDPDWVKQQDGEMVTHRSLIKQMIIDKKKHPIIYSAGEFEIFNGKVSSVTNQSGTYSIDNQAGHLNFGASQLRKKGLPIEINTRIADASINGRIAPPHQTVLQQIQRQSFYEKLDPILDEDLYDSYHLLKKLKRDFYELYQREGFPKMSSKPIEPGKFDQMWVLNWLSKHSNEVAKEFQVLYPEENIGTILESTRELQYIQTDGEGPSYSMKRLTDILKIPALVHRRVKALETIYKVMKNSY